MKHKNTFSGLEFKRPPENNLHFPWGQFRIIYVLCRNCMVTCYTMFQKIDKLNKILTK